MDKPTLQEIFDRVATHLLTQGKRAVGSESECRYRTEAGLMCAIGCLIEPKLYSPGMEKKSLRNIAVHGPVSQSLGLSAKEFINDGPYFELLDTLRIVHDHGAIKEWKADLKELAADRGLEWNHD
jgi:hypothetical protein